MSVPEEHAVEVFEMGPDRLLVGEDEEVFDCEVDAVLVFVAVVVLVVVLDPVVVFVPGSVIVACDEEDGDFDDELVLVDVIVTVIVFVEVGVGLGAFVGNEERDNVVVFVDVFDNVDVAVGTTMPAIRLR